jgi:transposase
MKRLPNSTVQNAIVLLQQGKSCTEVSNTLNISISSAIRIRKRNNLNIPSPKMGPPSKVSKRTKHYIANQYNIGKLETMKDGQKLIQSVEGVQVNKKTIRNYLRSENMATFIKQKKPYLTDNHKRARYKFAKDHLNWTVEDWKNVMFSDETIISRIGSYGKKYYYKRPGDKTRRPHHIKKTMQGGGGKMMIWGCITYFGLGDACWIPYRLDSVSYVEVLKDYVFTSRDYYGINNSKFLFQQDNATCHTSKTTMDYIKKSKIPLIVWPANSPDLNLIENVWSHLKMKLDQYPEEPRNIDELWERVQDIWTEIPIDFLQDLYRSMPKRIREVYRSKGDTTKY